MIYKGKEESLNVWVSSDIGWNVVTNWDERISLTDGREAHYNKEDNVQMISWRIDNIEYSIDYEGYRSKEDLIKIASSFE
jgi:hypothetical protein